MLVIQQNLATRRNSYTESYNIAKLSYTTNLSYSAKRSYIATTSCNLPWRHHQEPRLQSCGQSVCNSVTIKSQQKSRLWSSWTALARHSYLPHSREQLRETEYGSCSCGWKDPSDFTLTQEIKGWWRVGRRRRARGGWRGLPSGKRPASSTAAFEIKVAMSRRQWGLLIHRFSRCKWQTHSDT